MPWWAWVLVLYPVFAIPASIGLGKFFAAGNR